VSLPRAAASGLQGGAGSRIGASISRHIEGSLIRDDHILHWLNKM